MTPRPRFCGATPDRELTLTDAVGLHLMRARRIRHCWSTDRHLALAGATLAIDAN
ncbi:MAG: hypothetical protein RML56_06370 [Burkholderiales bacterium]|nr:hypothetical protein [Burkholderiales bacterium]